MKDISIPRVIGAIVALIVLCALTGTMLGFISGIAYTVFCKFM